MCKDTSVTLINKAFKAKSTIKPVTRKKQNTSADFRESRAAIALKLISCTILIMERTKEKC